MKYTHLLFDLDGTLIYSHPGIFKSVNYALDKLGLPRWTEEQMRPFVGPPLRVSFQKFMGFSPEEAERAVAFYRERYRSIGWREFEPIAGVKELLEDLKKAGYILALATSKPAVFADQIVKDMGVWDCFDQGGVAQFDHDNKTYVIEEIVRRFQADKEKCLMIGDRLYDVVGAKEVGVDCAGLYVGYGEENELEKAGATYVFKDFAALREFLL